MTLLSPVIPARSARSTGWVPFALIALVVIPAPLPVVVHITCAVPYAVLGAFQFSSRLRRRHPRWHRSSGRLVVGLGLDAIALAAGTRTLTLAVGPGVFGSGVLTKGMSLGAAWVLNLAVAELVIHRSTRPRAARSLTLLGAP
jgi:hypothetical protein